MRGQPSPAATASFSALAVDILARTIAEEFPELDKERLRAAVERAVARAATSSLDTEGYRVVDLHLQRAEATEESSERAQILRELADNLEQRNDAERAMVVRLAAFTEVPIAAELDPLLRLARITERWSELPLDTMSALVDIQDDESPRRLTEMATAWEKVGRGYNAADCLERVLLLDPANAHANETLELFYRTSAEWPVLIDLLGRRAVHVASDRERAELYREIGVIYERELADDSGALDAYQEADRLEPGRAEVVEALARLAVKIGLPEDEQLAALERVTAVTGESKSRAQALCKAAELARNQDWDKAQDLFERARRDDPDLAPAVDGLVLLLRDRGQLTEAIAVLEGAADRPALAHERSRWLADAGDYRVANGDFDAAKVAYRAAREADPGNHRAGVALVELCWDTGSLVELAPILDELCRTTDDPERLRHYLIQRTKVAVELGEATAARRTLARAVDLDPQDKQERRELADLLFTNQEWLRARPLLEGLLDEEDALAADDATELHYRVARCAQQLGDASAAAKHAQMALARTPGHRPSMLLRAELDAADPEELLADQLELANTAPVEERAGRFAALGDRYVERGDRATGREMYREALRHRPGDHLLLTKLLSLVADEGDWSYSLDLLQRLIDTETDAGVRARYRHTAAMIARDELDDDEAAAAQLDLAIEDDPMSFTAADELEAVLAAGSDRDALARFYYRRLEHVRAQEGRSGERLRLWDHLGDLCNQLGRTEDAVVAFEVALSLAPDDAERRTRLADLYLDADPRHAVSAIVQHQAVLRANKRRVASYRALRDLYARTQQLDKARAARDALAALAAHVDDKAAEPDQLDALFTGDVTDPASPTLAAVGDPASPDRKRTRGLPTKIALGNEDWVSLARLDVDGTLTALFAVAAPAFAAERARLRPPPSMPARETAAPEVLARTLARVCAAFGVTAPPVFADPDQLTPFKLALRVREGAMVPALFLGPSADALADEQELAFGLARQLADLRAERIARLLCPRPGELGQIIELVASTATESGSHAAKWLTTSLHPVELDRVRSLGARLRERGVQPLSAALGWLAATERAADRIGLVVTGELAACLRVIDRELSGSAVSSGDLNRVLDLIWASVTEEVLTVRARVEGWRQPEVA